MCFHGLQLGLLGWILYPLQIHYWYGYSICWWCYQVQKTRYQDTIAQSSTEAEFIAAIDAGHTILFFCSLLNDLNVPQHDATILFEDNCRALQMANAQQPTHNTHHCDIMHFAILTWVQQDLHTIQAVLANDDGNDTCAKPLGKQ
jgi:hypothetical protein